MQRRFSLPARLYPIVEVPENLEIPQLPLVPEPILGVVSPPSTLSSTSSSLSTLSSTSSNNRPRTLFRPISNFTPANPRRLRRRRRRLLGKENRLLISSSSSSSSSDTSRLSSTSSSDVNFLGLRVRNMR